MAFLKGLLGIGGKTSVDRFDLEDHMRGALYGNATGDAIGLLSEFMMKDEVKKYYGKHKHLEYEHKVPDFHRERWACGDWTDDTDQMICIMDSLLSNNGEIDVVDCAKRFKSWMLHGYPELGDHAGMGLGQTTSKVLTHPKYLEDPHMASNYVWEANHKKIAPNGAVMRTSVIGVHRFTDIETVKKNAEAVCRCTHADPRCIASCIAVTTAIALMLQRQPRHVKPSGAYDINAITEESFEHAKQVLPAEDDEAEALLWKHMFASKLSKLDLCETGKIGYTYKCMGSGFWALRQNNFRDALEQIVREGGDADTNGAVAGALLGCKLGYKNIPDSWKSNLKHKDWFEEKVTRLFSIDTSPATTGHVAEVAPERLVEEAAEKNKKDEDGPACDSIKNT